MNGWQVAIKAKGISVIDVELRTAVNAALDQAVVTQLMMAE